MNDEQLKQEIENNPHLLYKKNPVTKEIDDLLEKLRNQPITFERQYLPESDYKLIATTEAGKIPHQSVQEYLTDCDKIYDWLTQNPKKRA